MQNTKSWWEVPEVDLNLRHYSGGPSDTIKQIKYDIEKLLVNPEVDLRTRQIYSAIYNAIEDIKAEKERIASLLKSGKMKQAEYDKALVKLWAEEDKLKNAIVNKSKTFDQILVESRLSSEQKTKLLEIKALKDVFFVTNVRKLK